MTAVLCVTAPGSAGDSAHAHASDDADIVRTVAPFLQRHCSDCHGEDDPEAGFSVVTLKADIHAGNDLRAWIEIARRLKAGDMPPEDQPQPDPKQVAAVVKAIQQAIDAAGATGVVRPGSLQTGNQVDHDLLFNAPWSAPLYAPPRLWRVSNHIYRQWADDVTAGAVLKGAAGKRITRPFSIPPGDGFAYLANSRGVDEATAAQLVRNAEQLVLEQTAAVVEKTRRARRTPLEFVPLLTATEMPSQNVIEKAIRKQFQLALRREPTAQELGDYTKLFRTNFETAGAVIGTRATLMAILLHPEAVFRFEIGNRADAAATATDGRAGRQTAALRVRMLTPREIVFAVAYALTDEPPPPQLLKLADEGRLRTPRDVAALVRQMLDDPKLRKPRILRFFQEYFGYTRATDVFKDKKPFPAFRADTLVDDTNRLVEHVLRRDRRVFETLLTTNESFVAYSRTEEAQKRIRQIVADFEKKKKKDPAKYANAEPKIADRQHFLMYNLNDFVPPAKQPVRLPAEQRAGILTQPSWLVAFSGNFDNDPVRRGKWVRERLLGGTVPELPITVNAQLPDAPHQTLRQRMAVTRETYCWQCHRKMNPLGLTFENFDHFGRFRTTESVLDPEATARNVDAKGRTLGAVMREVPVDASGRIDYTGDPALDGRDVRDSLELVRVLAGSDRVRQVFIRHAFRYWMGREENLGDARTLRAADRAYVESNGSFKALLVALLSSESFLMRTVPDTAAPVRVERGQP